jgi:hypothetical protein
VVDFDLKVMDGTNFVMQAVENIEIGRRAADLFLNLSSVDTVPPLPFGFEACAMQILVSLCSPGSTSYRSSSRKCPV